MSQLSSRKPTIKRTALAVMLGLCLSQAPNAFAQATSGDIVGTASYASGAQIQITNPASGISRTVALGADGRFRIPALPTGQYDVKLVEDGQTVANSTTTVLAGQTAQVNLTEAGAKSLATVKVTGPMVINDIDTSSVESRTTFTASQLNELPVPRDVSSVAKLTPGTSTGSGYFGNVNSFGGASVAENSYYVNGMNVTNSYDNLSFSEVPWQAIDQLDVQTGGYGAQYGFSTGGVTSVNVKRGTNEWHGGISWDSAPDSLAAHTSDEYFSDGSLYRPLSKNRSNSNTWALWEGGPLIKDKLFFFAIAQYNKTTGSTWGGRSSASGTTASENDYNESKPYKLVKLDWFLNDSNHLEFTGFDNSSRTTYDYNNIGFEENKAFKDGYNGRIVSKSGGPTGILKWTSNLTDDLTMALQYGKMKTVSEQYAVTADGTHASYAGNINSPATGCPYVSYEQDYVGAQNSCYMDSTLGINNGYSQRKDYRLDFDWTLGDHELSFGYDYNDFTARQGESYSGGHAYDYTTDDDGNQIVYDDIYATGGTVEVKQNSWYVQDHWHVTDDFLLSLGIRNDSFKNYNSTGGVFVKQDNIWQPRLGFSWDMTGDGTSRLYGNLGRYALPIAANVALRGASASIYSETAYSYSGVDSTGSPIDPVALGDTVYFNGENGTTPSASSAASKGLKPYTQDEAILGFEHRLSSGYAFLDGWVLGAKGTYRKVHNAIDDSCSSQALYDAATADGYDTSGFDEWTAPEGSSGCWLYNPGSASTINVDVDGNGSLDTITMSADSLGPKAKRTYKAMTLSAQKASDRWYVNASYTWSQSKGNYEGLVKSNNGQADTGTTADFDFAQIMEGAYGFLPNDHMHSFKAYGGFKITPEWQVGVNLEVQSGAPISCYGGGYGTLGTEYGYTSQFHYCNGEISNEGTQGRNPWTFTLSPNLVYKPTAIKGLTAQVSILNLFNNEKPLQVYQTYEAVQQNGTTYYANYRLGQYYQEPRYARLQLMYEW
ncbi:TonB-dependent receptor [Pseudoxanthomonas sp.]|uniref:TonB-dependent receptor n=1 Tax=Pseudoxanthomonas sp. TaxID=1871049 RepID=UPI0026056ABB|nr:TonB-dependent receptor [Pseudoxanthomonas sp.]WDS36641.1 MAG: TonB-dependent receptor [Pseudoxanthomonas sp.]